MLTGATATSGRLDLSELELGVRGVLNHCLQLSLLIDEWRFEVIHCHRSAESD